MGTIRRHSQTPSQVARREWQHLGLVSGFLAGRHFLGTKDLHYGYWVKGHEPKLSNLPAAQDAYSDFLMKHIPWTSKKILDVGSGAATLARKLLDRGHKVDCVSPCESLNNEVRTLLGDDVRLFDCRYEDFELSELYDAVVFCESFQYVDMGQALARAAWQLCVGSRVIICDFFSKDDTGDSPIDGGHKLNDFKRVLNRFPFRIIQDVDITEYVAPTFAVVDRLFCEVVQPIWREVNDTASRTHPFWTKVARSWFKFRLQKFESKYLSRERTAENFERYKTYRLFVLERKQVAA